MEDNGSVGELWFLKYISIRQYVLLCNYAVPLYRIIGAWV